MGKEEREVGYEQKKRKYWWIATDLKIDERGRGTVIKQRNRWRGREAPDVGVGDRGSFVRPICTTNERKSNWLWGQRSQACCYRKYGYRCWDKISVLRLFPSSTNSYHFLTQRTSKLKQTICQDTKVALVLSYYSCVYTIFRYIQYVASLNISKLSVNGCQSRIWAHQYLIQKHLFGFGITNHFGMFTIFRKYCPDPNF